MSTSLPHVETLESPDLARRRLDGFYPGVGRTLTAPGQERIQRIALAFGFRMNGAIVFIADETMQSQEVGLGARGGPEENPLDLSGNADIVMQ